ncbi:hypothetical protein ACFX15_012225 [Malus domestica]
MSSVSAISSSLLKRTIPFCSSAATTTLATTGNGATQFLFLKKPIFPSASHLLAPALPDPPDQPSTLPELPGISTSPEVDSTTTILPEVRPYPPPLEPGPNPGPDFPVPPLNRPLVPDIPPRFPDNPLPNPGILPPQPPDVVPPPPPGPEIIPPQAPPPPPTGPGGRIVV